MSIDVADSKVLQKYIFSTSSFQVTVEYSPYVPTASQNLLITWTKLSAEYFITCFPDLKFYQRTLSLLTAKALSQWWYYG